MKTEVEKIDETRVKLSIFVEPSELKPYMDEAYQAIAEQVAVPGFRKGKVPAPIIDQRVGREAVISEAVNAGLDDFYRQGVEEADVRPIGRPAADIAEVPDAKTLEGSLKIVVEVDVRPEFELPALEGRKVTVDAAEVTDAEIDTELDELRGRFGTLVTVDRPAAKGDFLQLDLTATIDGAVVDNASGISYELGSGELLDGIDDAVETLTADEETTFSSTLVGGDHAGKEAEVSVKVLAVKERELPEADDDFAQMASAQDTLAELRDELKQQVSRRKSFGQADEARKKLQDDLVEESGIPTPTKMIEDEVHRHLEGEGRLEDDVHRAEVAEQTETVIKSQILFDRIAEEKSLEVTNEELTQYIVQMASQYGMPPQDLVETLQQNGQMNVVMADLLRGKTLSYVLSKSTVVDSEGNEIDMSDFVPDFDAKSEEQTEEA
ncbi:trigger factor [Agrococcus casei]|uniref:Trigger factor n=1 Tax=Agrococcus casei LMG 22410 TaxID=1255656 RepID=A0A1R4G695_9MICO|nr:Cell division trigger factor [Agrococcus casei LMG 22410]